MSYLMNEPAELPGAREAMRKAIERASVGDYEGGHIWLAIARELRAGSVSVPAGRRLRFPELVSTQVPQQTSDLGSGAVQVPTPEPAFRRAETEVLQRISTESTPEYEAAGQSLEDTRSIPVRVAHPRADSEGPNSECLSCTLPLVWIRGRGWAHDTPSHSVSCDAALGELDSGPSEVGC